MSSDTTQAVPPVDQSQAPLQTQRQTQETRETQEAQENASHTHASLQSHIGAHESLPQPPQPIASLPTAIDPEKPIRVHYYVKIGVSTFLCALLLLIGVPVFMESRVTGSLSYTALGVVMVAFGLILALAVLVLLFNPPFKARMGK